MQKKSVKIIIAEEATIITSILVYASLGVRLIATNKKAIQPKPPTNFIMNAVPNKISFLICCFTNSLITILSKPSVATAPNRPTKLCA